MGDGLKYIKIFVYIAFVLVVFHGTFLNFAEAAGCQSNTAEGDWSDGATWAGCNGVGGIPAADDIVQIIDGNTVNVTSASEASEVEILSGGSLVLSGASSVLTLNGTSNSGAVLLSNSGTFTANSASTVVFNSPSVSFLVYGAGAQAITFGNLTISPDLAENYSLSMSDNSDAITVNGNLTIAPSGANTLTFGFGGGTLAFASNSVFTVDSTGSAVSSVTLPLGGDLSLGKIVIGSGDSLDASSVESITLSGTSGTLLTQSGTFTAPSIVSMNPDASVTLTSGAIAFNTLTLSPTINEDRTYTFGSGAVTVNGDFNINPTSEGKILTASMGAAITVTGTVSLTGVNNGLSKLDTTASNYALSAGYISISSMGTLIANNSNITLTGTSGTLFTRVGTFTAGTSTVIMNPDSAVTLTSGTVTFYNLTLSPTITLNRTYTFGSGAVTVSNNLDINPTAATTTKTLTVNLGSGGLTVATRATVSGTGTGVSNLDTTSSNYAITTGSINLESAGTLTANASTITLTRTTGTLFTRAGTFTAGTSTVIMNPDAAVTLTSGTVTFYNLTLSPTITDNRTYTFGAGAITVNSDFTVNPTAASSLTLTVNMGASISVATTKSIILTGTTNGLSVLDTVAGSNYALSTGIMDIRSRGKLTARASSVTVADDWLNAGTFNGGTSTVTLNSAATATVGSGPTTFYNLTISHSAAKEVQFSTNALHIIHVTNTFTVTGTSGNLISLFSSSSSTKWHFHPTGTASVSYVNLRDGGCESGSITITPTNTTNSGNNESCWAFNSNPTAPSSLGPAGLVNGGYTSDNTPTPTFTLSDADGSDTVKFRIQIDDSSDFSSAVVDYTSALAAQGSTSFTVGQATGSGTYTTGSSGQTLSDGSYYWRVKNIDNSAAESSYSTANSGAVAFIVDTTAPIISEVTPVPTPTNDTTPDYTFTTDEAGDITYGGDCASATSSATLGSNTITFSALSVGTHSNCTITVTDSAGNVSNTLAVNSFIVDTTAPTISSTAPATNAYIDSQTASYTFSESVASASIVFTRTSGTPDAGSPHTCTLQGTALASGAHTNLVLATGANSCVSWASSLVSGTVYSVAFNATDSAGNTATTVTNTSITYDTTAPIISEVTPVSTPTNDTTPSYTFTTNEAGDISYGGDCTSATSSASSGSNTISFSALADGTHSNCTIVVTDSATNASNTLVVTSFVVDTTAPVISEVTAVTTPTTDTTPDYTFTTDEAGTISYGGDCTSVTSSASSGSNTVTFSALSVGTHSNCTIVVTDSATNASNTLSVTSFVITEEQTNHTTYGSTANPNYIVAPPAVNTNGGGEAGLFLKNLFFGTNDPDVKRLQQYLNSRGFNIASTGPGSVGFETSFYGELTKAKVKLFQEAHRKEILTPLGYLIGTGEFGPSTRAYVNSTIGAVNIEPVITNPTTSYVFIRDLETGDRGPDVAKLQEILVKKGFLVIPPNNIPGLFGPLTKEAVMKYQSSMGLPVTGFVGPLTRDSLQK